MNFADDDEEIRFLSIFAKTEQLSAIDLATKQQMEKMELKTKKVLSATQQLKINHRKGEKKVAGEKQRLAQREVTTQGYASALHLHRETDTVNRAARGLVGDATSGLPVAVVKGDKVETQLGSGEVKEVRDNGNSLIVSVGWGLVHLRTKSLVNYGVGAIPISLESAYQRAKALYSDGQIQEALAIWLQGVKMLKGRDNPSALAAYLGAASQAERGLGQTRKALTHAEEALKNARMGGKTTSTLAKRLEKTVELIKTDLGENVGMNNENTYNFGLGIAVEEVLEMDPEALETVQDAINEAVHGDASTLKQLLEMSELLGNKDYSRGIARASTTDKKITALMVASAYGQVNVVKQLVRMGGDVNFKDSTGFTCLVWACRANQVEMANILLNELNANWIEPSPRASNEIKNLLNSIPKNKRGKNKSKNNNKRNNNNSNKNGGNSGRKSGKRVIKKNDHGNDSKGGRSLQKWSPSDHEKSLKVDGLGNKKDNSYDQFQANKKLGVKGKIFNEEEYTTKLNVKSKKKIDQASKLANEIEKNGTGSNRKKSKKIDAEDQHSAVIKSGNKKSGTDGFTDAEVNKKSSSSGKKNK
jgi:tetratricopeptide (TPR) repeat protein